MKNRIVKLKEDKKFLGACFFAIFIMINLSGCTEGKSDKTGIVDHLTGAQQVKNYDKTKTQIQDINKTLEERYKQI